MNLLCAQAPDFNHLVLEGTSAQICQEDTSMPRKSKALSDPAIESIKGTWQSSNFAYTFESDGTYVYVGRLGNAWTMSTEMSEEGTFRLTGDELVVNRKCGVITNSNGYRQNMAKETTVFQWQLGELNGRLAMQLVFPDGGVQHFFRVD
ncbi:MAG: hypothetical protein QM760_07075 [Nibricoccus sp.]